MKKIIFFILFVTITESYANSIVSFEMILENSCYESSTEALLDFIKKTNKPVILKFYADWCAPCKRMIPILKNVEQYFNNQIIIISINTDIYDALCNRFNIRYLPTLIYFKDGQERQRTNSINQEKMINIIKNLL